MFDAYQTSRYGYVPTRPLLLADALLGAQSGNGAGSLRAAQAVRTALNQHQSSQGPIFVRPMVHGPVRPPSGGCAPFMPIPAATSSAGEWVVPRDQEILRARPVRRADQRRVEPGPVLDVSRLAYEASEM